MDRRLTVSVMALFMLIVFLAPANAGSGDEASSGLDPLNKTDMRGVTAQQGLDLRFNVELGGGFSSDFIIRDPNSGGALHLDEIDVRVALGRYTSRTLQVDLDGNPAVSPKRPFLQITIPDGTDLRGKIISEDVYMEDLDGFSTSTLGGLYISNRSGNTGDLDLSGEISLRESLAD
ncbi:MAG: hypothetical protein ABEK50_06220 [bacterium]